MMSLDEKVDTMPCISTQRQYWNEWNRKNRRHERLDVQPWDARRRGTVVLDLLKALKPESPRILEIGCSTGWLSHELSRYGSVTAVDLADEAIHHAQGRLPDVHFLAGDVLGLDLGPARFDVVVSLETIAHVNDKKAFCDTVYALLNDRGYIILTTQNRTIWERTSWLETPDAIIQEFMTMRELKTLLQPKFRVLHARTTLVGGNQGILKIFNSRKLLFPFQRLFGDWRVSRFKEWLGLGNTLVVLAQKR